MEITIYELLGLILDDDAPRKIKYKNNIYEYDGETQNYYKSLNFTKDWLIGEDITAFLNDEVEILEEDKKIKYPILHKTAPSETTGDQMPNWRNLIDCNFEYLNKTICQLIDEINNLKEK